MSWIQSFLNYDARARAGEDGRATARGLRHSARLSIATSLAASRKSAGSKHNANRILATAVVAGEGSRGLKFAGKPPISIMSAQLCEWLIGLSVPRRNEIGLPHVTVGVAE